MHFYGDPAHPRAGKPTFFLPEPTVYERRSLVVHIRGMDAQAPVTEKLGIQENM
jgi:hypothetical protein